ncbi:hypothetical protein GlitD10_2425 [Gloeomargarita lithophora Alchichica-D10]|uniref:Uncharacterized protein n=1 Tax=Gloeomargarita lithophora Alchichica-D10 TaxID=1188229 RepID=A0A1J0AFR4_9CYAN|nr:hypothetical protein [Gloeomargarita lithophora]APB34759.1 hypothetical protein GlitD10_2425 [Gloeomargarita lithophora Alchichica-D10]
MDTQQQARLLMMQRSAQIRNRQQNLLGRTAAEAGITQLHGYFGHIQGKVQPTFRIDYDHGSSALS